MSTKTIDSAPWRALPPAVADLLEPELEATTAEILATIGSEVPEYARPLEGSFGRGLRRGVSEALRQFLDLIRDPDAGRDPGREVYVALGRGELGQGRTLDSLQAAYRVGARVAWRRLSATARRAELDAEALSVLAEAIFAYIDELSADSVEGYAEARAEVDDLRRRRRDELAALLVREPPAPAEDVAAAAAAAGWPLPRTAAALACGPDDLERLARRLPADVLAVRFGDEGCLLVPDPGGAGRLAGVGRVLGGTAAALGPTGPLELLPSSWDLARATLRASAAGRLPAAGMIEADGCLGDLLIAEGGSISRRIARLRLAPLDGLTAKGRARMEETALSYVRHGGGVAAMAADLHLHPQTVRYRVARLRERFGESLDDPAARFELEVAIRVAASSRLSVK